MIVRDAPDRGRFEIVDDDRVVGFAEYRVQGAVAVMPHTVVDENRRGEGLGEQLVRAAVEELQGRGLTIDPVCWFVADHLEG